MSIATRALAVLVLLAGPGGSTSGSGFPEAVRTAEAGQIAQSAQAFAITIDGTAGTSVVAACLVSHGDDAEVVGLDGEVPLQRRFEATGLACQIKKLSPAGRMVVEVSKNGRVVSRHVSSGSAAVVSVSVQ